MLSFITGSYLAYKQEVNYTGFNEAIRVTLASYHRSRIQGASTINLSLSTTLILTINTLLSLGCSLYGLYLGRFKFYLILPLRFLW